VFEFILYMQVRAGVKQDVYTMLPMGWFLLWGSYRLRRDFCCFYGYCCFCCRYGICPYPGGMKYC